MRTVGAGQVDDEPQFAGGVVHVLTFERTLLGLVGPRETFVDVEETVGRAENCDDAPAGCLGNLW